MKKLVLLIISLASAPQNICVTLPAAINKENAQSVGTGVAALVGSAAALGSAFFVGQELPKLYRESDHTQFVASIGYSLTALYVAGKLVPYGVKKCALKKAELNSQNSVYADRKKAAAFVLGATSLLAGSGLFLYSALPEFKKSIERSNSLPEQILAGSLISTVGFAVYDLVPKIYKNAQYVIKPLFEKKENK